MCIDFSNIGSCVLKLCTLDSCENEIYVYMCRHFKQNASA